MRLTLTLVLLLSLASAHAEKTPWVVSVADNYLEMRSGPGRGYPVFHTVENAATVTVIKQRTGWYKVRAERDITGWVASADLEKMHEVDGSPVNLARSSLDQLVEHRWRAGFTTGDFGGANVLSLYGGYNLTPNLSVELAFGQALGPFAENVMATASVVHQFVPQRRLTPFFSLTGGMIRTDPAATLVRTEDRTDQLAAAGAGVRAWITRQFVFRAEYRSYVVFTSRDDNQEIDEWKAGFTFYF
ncbi:MAG: SH3 domain-containing protein [Gammaproteobacteria bacterium]|nr:SH3 domain-containing protein [Gammaproteobacteria bacterium]NNF61787.1 SH3 domain-containing protein [Gammaproteobacteria bacterium]NNM20454.1 SH3 domain-containing protein [Gammaproteobacteria bacterium]